MLAIYPELKKIVEQSADPFDMALRLAVAGNVIDFGSQHQLNIMDTIKRVAQAEFAINHSGQLKKDIATAQSILYIGDNCGEIVLDRLSFGRQVVADKNGIGCIQTHRLHRSQVHFPPPGDTDLRRRIGETA